MDGNDSVILEAYHSCYQVELNGVSRLYPISLEFVIGRGKCSDLQIASPSVSRNQCEIRCTEHGWNIVNKSTNGTSINGTLLNNADAITLSNSDILIIGDVYLQFFLDVNSERFRLPTKILRIIPLVGADHCTLNMKIREESQSGTSSQETVCMMEQQEDMKFENVAETNSQENSKKQSKLVEGRENDTGLMEKLNQLRHNNLKLAKELEESNKAYKQVVSEKEEAILKFSQIKEEVSRSIEELIETELQCSICHEIVINATTSNCSHTFCEYCFTKWTKKNNACPVCRTSISSHIRTKMIDNYIEKLILNFPEELQAKRKEMVEARKELTNALTENHRPRKRRRGMTTASRNGRQAITITLQNLRSLMDTTIDISSDDESPVFLFQQSLQP